MARTWIPGAVILLLAACGGGAAGGGQASPPDDTAQGPSAPAQTVTDGPDKVFDAEGRLEMEGDMKNGKRHGVWTSYFPDGHVRSRNEYRNGELEGITTAFRANGAPYYTGQHHRDREAGLWRFFDDKGDLARIVEYDSTGTVINDRPAGRE